MIESQIDRQPERLVMQVDRSGETERELVCGVVDETDREEQIES